MQKNPRYYNLFSILCGVWFLFTGWIWVYFMNIVISFPVAIAGILLWNKGRKVDRENKWNKVALVIHITGIVASAASLVVLLFFN